MKGLISLLLTACLVGPAMADSASVWLERMSHAHREVSYSGVVSYQVDGHLSSYRLVHRVDEGHEYEELKPLDSDTANLVRTGHSIHCVHPAEQLIRNGAEPLARYYQFSLEGNGRVAGREVVNLLISPRDVFRLSYRLSLDTLSAVPLRSETLDRDGNVLERFQFMMFELNPSSVSEAGQVANEVHHSTPLQLEEAAQILARSSWRPQWLPEGFTVTRPDDNDGSVLSFTDGLAMFSVFLEASDVPVSSSVMRSGATVSYTYPLEGRQYIATVMGEIPLLTAEQVAKSVSISAGR